VFGRGESGNVGAMSDETDDAGPGEVREVLEHEREAKEREGAERSPAERRDAAPELPPEEPDARPTDIREGDAE